MTKLSYKIGINILLYKEIKKTLVEVSYSTIILTLFLYLVSLRLTLIIFEIN